MGNYIILMINSCWLYVIIIALIILLMFVCIIWIDRSTQEIQELKEINKAFISASPPEYTYLPQERYTCRSKQEFDRWVASPLTYLDVMLEKHHEWCAKYPTRLNALMHNYEKYQQHVTKLENTINAWPKMLRIWRFRYWVLPEPSDIAFIVNLEYTSPAGRNSYCVQLSMPNEHLLEYCTIFPNDNNIYTPDAILHPFCVVPDKPGTYVIHNITDDMYYVGQATSLQKRLKQHFTGHGNGDVYVDYRTNKTFEITIYELENSRFQTLNEQERYYITKHKAFEQGYNKTHGNK